MHVLLSSVFMLRSNRCVQSHSVFVLFVHVCTVQARQEPQRDPGNHYCWAVTQPYSVGAEIKTLKASREETWGGVSPHRPTKGLGERRKLPQLASGQSLGLKCILCIFEVRKKPSGTLFSVFMNNCVAPKCRGAQENFPLSTGPLDRPACVRLCMHLAHFFSRNSPDLHRQCFVRHR